MNILIISRDTYPIQHPRAFRTAELSEELALRGHNVIVYIANNDFNYNEYILQTKVQIKKIKLIWAIDNKSTFFNYIKKILKRILFYSIAFPEIEYRYKLTKILKKEQDIDLLITIAYPHAIHWGAAKSKDYLGKLFPKLWIADCGDPFILNPFIKVPNYFEKIEKDWCNKADFITVPTDESYKGYFPEFSHKIRVIPQGFKIEKTPISQYKPNIITTFAFTGYIYPKQRDLLSFIKYLASVQENFKFKLFLYSDAPKEYHNLLKDKIEVIVNSQRKDIIYELSKMDFLINIKNPNQVQLPSKLIDYSITKRPILEISNNFKEHKIFYQFLKRDYSNACKVPNIDNYRIEKIVDQIIQLTNEKLS